MLVSAIPHGVDVTVSYLFLLSHPVFPKSILVYNLTFVSQIELAKALARSEEFSARVAQQSADLNRAVQALTSLSNL